MPLMIPWSLFNSWAFAIAPNCSLLQRLC